MEWLHKLNFCKSALYFVKLERYYCKKANTQPETPPTSAATSPSLPSSPPPSSTISAEGSVDGIIKERIKKRKRTTYEGTRTTSMSLRCEILTTRAVQGKRLL
ncbi:hypothetical protein ABEB36_011801 [Hypothenemus hampei]|uniref:Uncharacterized protein n=1 Tax=Hypothenemus hampei TaxID=57062 RepID=A0ABD1E9W2_HYPHA